MYHTVASLDMAETMHQVFVTNGGCTFVKEISPKWDLVSQHTLLKLRTFEKCVAIKINDDAIINDIGDMHLYAALKQMAQVVPSLLSLEEIASESFCNTFAILLALVMSRNYRGYPSRAGDTRTLGVYYQDYYERVVEDVFSKYYDGTTYKARLLYDIKKDTGKKIGALNTLYEVVRKIALDRGHAQPVYTIQVGTIIIGAGSEYASRALFMENGKCKIENLTEVGYSSEVCYYEVAVMKSAINIIYLHNTGSKSCTIHPLTTLIEANLIEAN